MYISIVKKSRSNCSDKAFRRIERLLWSKSQTSSIAKKEIGIADVLTIVIKALHLTINLRLEAAVSFYEYNKENVRNILAMVFNFYILIKVLTYHGLFL
ncbi:MAG TPA: hypothetical protein VE619_02510 [Nitrososphaeraceae archaeon]|nr:hypothetical protein [Nitrososphaeraceae archaeon]